MYTKKSLGQHWLRDLSVLDEVADLAQVNENDVVLEVGPGLGTLTTVLLERGATVIAVEKDERLIPDLENLQKKYKKLHIEQADILDCEFSDIPKGYKVAANIPYYLTSNLIRVLLETENAPSIMSLLIQKEVAERIAAQPGKMSILSFSVQYYADIVLGSVVPAVMFEPAPKVDSQIISIRLKQAPAFTADTKLLFQLVRAGFSEKRKKLTNALSGGLRIEKTQAHALLSTAGISQEVRAQELAMEDWRKLYDAWEKMV